MTWLNCESLWVTLQQTQAEDVNRNHPPGPKAFCSKDPSILVLSLPLLGSIPCGCYMSTSLPGGSMDLQTGSMAGAPLQMGGTGTPHGVAWLYPPSLAGFRCVCGLWHEPRAPKGW